MSNNHLRTFYTILITQAISQIGSQMTSLAIGIWLYQETGNVTPLALVTFFGLVPHVLLANIAGLIVDRYDRRKIMALADTGAAVGSLVLMLLFFSGAFQVWHLYVIVLVQEICRAFQNPAYMASVTMLVPDAQRDRSNAIMQLTGPLAGIIAPALTAVLYVVIGVAGVIVVDLTTFAIAITAMLLSHIPRPPRSAEGEAATQSLWKEMTGGFAYLWQYKALLAMLGFAALINFVAMGWNALQTPYILARTGSEATLGVLLSIASIGAIAGGVVMGAWGGTRPRIHTAMPAIILFGVFLALVGVARTPLMIGFAMFCFMAAPMFANISLMSMLQAKVPPDMQGRVFAIVTQVALLVSPLSPLLVGPLADRVFEPAVGTSAWLPFAPLVGNETGAGMGLILTGAGLIVVVVGIIAYALPLIRQMEANIPDWQPAVAVAEG